MARVKVATGATVIVFPGAGAQAVRICLKWVLGIKLRTFERTVSTLKY